MSLIDTLKAMMQEAKDSRPDPVAEFLNNSGIANILADLDDDLVEPDEALQNLRQELCSDTIEQANARIDQANQRISDLESERDQAQRQVKQLERERDQLRQQVSDKDDELKQLKSSTFSTTPGGGGFWSRLRG